MDSLEAELDQARSLSVSDLADAIESIGFECTDCGACCKAATCGDEKRSGAEQDGDEESTGSEQGGDEKSEPHTATIFPDEVRSIQKTGEYDWRDIARPMPYGLSEKTDGPVGETFEWALQTDECGDCIFHEPGRCTIYQDRPLVCRTYPFSVDLGGTSQPMGEAVDREGMVRAHECEGLGRDISSAEAVSLAATLKERAIRELEEAIAVRDEYEPATATDQQVIVHDSEGAKRPDGSEL